MKRASIGIGAIVALALGGVALAAGPAAQHSSQELLDAIKSAPCTSGLPRDADGVCPTVGDQTRGFSLVPSSNDQPAAPAPTASGPTASGPVHTRANREPIRTAALVSGAPRAQPSSPLSDLLITFKRGSADLTKQGRANAANFATVLRDPSVATSRFEIAGHTDASGSPERNRLLSKQRADAVTAYLVSQGVDPSRLQAQGYGPSQLRFPESPRAAGNRRVEARRLD